MRKFLKSISVSIFIVLAGCGDKITNITNVIIPEPGVWYVSNALGIQDHSDPNADSSLAWVLKKIGDKSAKVVFPGNWKYVLQQNLVIPSNVMLDLQPGAIISIGSKANLDIQGFLNPTEYQIFEVDGSVFLRNAQYLYPQWFGAKGDGVADDTKPIQDAINCAAQFYNQVGYPPAGGRYSPPLIFFKPGSYRLLNELIIYSGLTLSGLVSNPFTTGHTRIIMDLPGNNKNILRATRYFQGARRTANLNFTIQDLEFWYVPLGGTVTVPYGESYGNDNEGNPLYKGCAIFVGEQCIDVRIKRCNFYQSPDASILLANDPSDPNSKLRNILIDECEFDSGNRFIRADNVTLDLSINSSLFFSGNDQYYITNCTGDITTNASRFQYSARVRVERSQLNNFHFVGNTHTDSDSKGFIHLERAKIVNISSNTFGVTTQSTIHVILADAGVIANNSIDNSGYNTTFQTPSANPQNDNVPAAIRLWGCQNVIVSTNSISTTDLSGIYGGFGIYTLDFNQRISHGNYIISNRVSGQYNGAIWRNQDRKVNIAPNDIERDNVK